MTNKRHTAQELRGGRVAASIIFFVLGAANGAWLSRIPDVRAALGMDESVLGTLLLVGAVSGLAAMQAVPHLLRRFGHRRLLSIVAPLFPLSILGITFATDPVSLGLALAVFCATGSVTGIIINTHAVDVERAYERVIMSSFHAMFSVGALTGAAIGGLMAGAEISYYISIPFTSLLLAIMVVAVIRKLLPVAHASARKVDASIDHLAHHGHKRAWWLGVLLLGGLTFVGFLAEGAIADWSAIFMREVRHASPGVAVAAFVAFSACMTIGRLAGDRITEKLGKITTIRIGAILAAIGLIIGIFTPNSATAIAGFAIVGCGLAVLVPVLFSIAGSLAGGESHAAIARVSTIAYFGLLMGPAAIGFIAHHVNISYALLVPAVLLTVVSFASPLIRTVTRRQLALESIHPIATTHSQIS